MSTKDTNDLTSKSLAPQGIGTQSSPLALLGNLVSKSRSEKDIATTLISYPIFFGIDSAVPIVPATPAYVAAGLGASFTIGVISAWKILIRKHRKITKTREYAQTLPGSNGEVKEISALILREVSMFQAGLISEAEFDKAIAKAVANYRRISTI